MERGITLVALIVTILVIIILTAVGVKVLVDSDLIGTAEKTAELYENDKWSDNVKIQGKSYNNLSEYINNEIINENPNEIPNIYQKVKCLESSGTQWIDTGIDGNECYRLEINFFISINLDWWDSVISGYLDSFTVGLCEDSIDEIYLRLRDSEIFYPKSIKTNELNSFIVQSDEYELNGVKEDTGESANLPLATQDGKIYIANNSELSRPSCIKVGNVKTYNSDFILSCDFIPCYRISDSKPGMYDKVTKTFFVNQGTGEFGYETLDGTCVSPQ